MNSDAASLLRERGYRVTAQRLAVLRAVAPGRHLTADEVADAARADVGTISLQAVYDALGLLTEVGLVRRLQPAGSAALFEVRVRDNHHHLVCRFCGRMTDVDCAVGAAPCLTPSDDHGFEIDEAEILFWGRCAQCRSATTPAGSSLPAPEAIDDRNRPREEGHEE